jgi:hypothetical protein
MLYLLEVNALVAVIVAAFVFAVSGLIIGGILAWRTAKTYAAAQYRMYKRVASMITERQSVANRLAISRSFSRSANDSGLVRHEIQ